VAEPATTEVVRQMSTDELRLEKERGRSVGLGAVLAVALYCGFILATWLTVRDQKGTSNAATLLQLHAHKLPLVLSGFFLSVASLLVAGVLVHLLLAARSRLTLVPKVSLYVAIGGPVLAALLYPLYVLLRASAAAKFYDANPRTAAYADHLSTTGALHWASYAFFVAQILVAIAWFMTGWYGMRVGLLTRLVGSVAIAIGIASAFAPPLAALLQIFWLGAVAIMFLGESEQTPPAWKLGRPVPWSEVNAAREAGEDITQFEKSDQ
jgi:hypothetical protein